VGYHAVDVQEYNLADWALPGGEGFGWGIYRTHWMVRLAKY